MKKSCKIHYYFNKIIFYTTFFLFILLVIVILFLIDFTLLSFNKNIVEYNTYGITITYIYNIKCHVHLTRYSKLHYYKLLVMAKRVA